MDAGTLHERSQRARFTIMGVGLAAVGAALIVVGVMNAVDRVGYAKAPACPAHTAETAKCRWTGRATITIGGLEPTQTASSQLLPEPTDASSGRPQIVITADLPGDELGEIQTPVVLVSGAGLLERAEVAAGPYPVSVTVWHGEVVSVADASGSVWTTAYQPDRGSGLWGYLLGGVVAMVAGSAAFVGSLKGGGRDDDRLDAAEWERRWAEADARAAIVPQPRRRLPRSKRHRRRPPGPRPRN